MNTPFQGEYYNFNGLWVRKQGKIVLWTWSTATTTPLYNGLKKGDGTQYQVPVGKKLRLLGGFLNFVTTAPGRFTFCYGDNAVGSNLETPTVPTNETGFPWHGNNSMPDGAMPVSQGQTKAQYAVALPQWEVPASKYPYSMSYNVVYNMVVVGEEI